MRPSRTAPCAATAFLLCVSPLFAQGVIHTISSNADGFGAAVAAAGDLNSDGFADVLVGAPQSDAAGIDAGSVRAISGFDAQPLLIFNGQVPGSTLGVAIRTIGDVDADGSIDWIAGAPGGTGFIYVVSSATGAILHSMSGTAGENFGFAVTGLGDVDNNGMSDIAVGAPTALGSTGAAHVILFPSTLPKLTYAGTAPGGMFGYAVAGPGDVDGDSNPDFAIGAPKDGQGIVKVYRGATTSTAWVLVGSCPDCPTDPGIKALFGHSLASIGDVNQDGFAEVAVGAVVDGSASEAWDSAGLVFSGGTGTKLLQVKAGGPEWIGFSSLLGAVRIGDAVGDLDGDGQSDMLVSSHGVLTGGGSSIVRAYSLPSGSPIVSASVAGHGSSCSAAGDTNADGFADIVVGAPDQSQASILSTECHSSSPFGTGCKGPLSKAPSLSLAGCFVPGGTLTLRLKDAAGTSTLVLLVSGSAAHIPLIGDCTLFVAPPLISFVVAVPASGAFSQPVELPITASLTDFRVQGFVLGGGLQGYAATAGVAVTID